MIWLSRIVKYHDATIDSNNRVSIQIMSSKDENLKVGKQEPIEVEKKDEEPEIDQQVLAKQIVGEAKSKAKGLEQAARKEAEDIVEDAKEKAHKQAIEIRENAYKEGYDDGVVKANKLADSLKAEVEVMRKEGEQYCQDLIKQIEPDMIELIVDILNKLLSTEVEINPKIISILIRQGLSKATLTEDISVHVSKEDYPNILESKDEILSSLDTMATVSFVEDPTLKRSDCIIETGFGNIDCSLGVQRDELIKNLYYILKNR